MQQQQVQQLSVQPPGPQHQTAHSMGPPPARPSPNLPQPPELKRPLRRDLSDWIPHPGILDTFHTKGVKSCYPWQAAALECGEDGSNLVYCAPTSGGKSLVAEVLMIRALLRRFSAAGGVRMAFGQVAQVPARALLILPYVSIVAEKAGDMTKVCAAAVLKMQRLMCRSWSLVCWVPG